MTDLAKAKFAALRIQYLTYFCTHPWVNKPSFLFTEFTEDFFGIKLIKAGVSPVILEWRDYISVLVTEYFQNITSIKIYGPIDPLGPTGPTLTTDIAGVDLTNSVAKLSQTSKSIIICYNGSISSSIKLIYKAVTYDIPTITNFNYVGINILTDKLEILSDNGISYISMLMGDDDTTGDLWELQMSNLKLYGLNLYDLLTTEQATHECDLIKENALKRVY